MFGNKRSLRGKKVFITGVGRRINEVPGIGERLAYALVERGAKVFITGIDRYELTRVASKCNQIGWRSGGHAYCTYCDVTDLEQVEQAMNMAVGRMGGLDTVVANAGVANVVTFQGDPDAFDLIMKVNVYGVYNTIRAAMPHIRHKDGYILTNASMGGVVRLFLMAAGYGTSKAAAATLGHAANLELIGTGARAGVVYLAEHESPMEDAFNESIPQRFMRDNPRLRAGHKARDPKRAVAAMVRAIERRSTHAFAPRYAALAGHFPIITNMITFKMHRNVRPALEMDRDAYAAKLAAQNN